MRTAPSAHEQVPTAARDGEPALGAASAAGALLAARAAALALIVLALWGDLTAAVQQLVIWPEDFASYYVPARVLARFPAISPYDDAAIARVNAAQHYVSGPFLPYIYPPAGFVALRPLAAFSFPTAYAIWIAVSHLCALGSALLLADSFVFLVERTAGSPGYRGALASSLPAVLRATSIRVGRWTFPTLPFAVCASVLLLANSARETYFLGQINFLVLFCLMLALNAYLRDHLVLAGAAIAVAGALKLTPLFFLAYFLARGAWKAVAAGLIATAALIAVSIPFLPAGAYAAFVTAISTKNSVLAANGSNRSLVGIITRGGALVHLSAGKAALLGDAASAAVILFTLGVVVLVSRRAGRGPSAGGAASLSPYEVRWLGFSTALATYLLVMPLVWTHYYIWALPGALLAAVYPLLRRRAEGEGWSRLDTVVVVWAGLALALLAEVLPRSATSGVPEWLKGTGPLATLVLWALLMWLLVRSLRTSPAAAAETASVGSAAATAAT